MKQTNHDKLVAELLANLPKDTEIILDFPSNGQFYDIKSGVTLRPMTFQDEKLLATHKDPNTTVNTLLERCMVGLDPKLLIPMDKHYVIYKLREISYGDDYMFTTTCPQCHQVSDSKVNISSLRVNKLPETVTNPREVLLPIISKIATVRSPRGTDEQYTELEVLAENLWRFVDSIGDCNDKTVIQTVLSKLPLKDIHTLIDAIMLPSYGLDTRFIFHCPHCEQESVVGVPLTPSFFTTN